MTRGQYKVGQVLFIVPRDRPAVVPVKVVEEVLRRTADGEATVYVVSWRVGQEEKTGELSRIGGEVFENPSRLRRELVKRSTAAVDRMVDAARKKAATYGFKEPQLPAQDGQERARVQKIRTTKAKAPDDVLVTEADGQGEFVHAQLPDGTKARVRL